MLKKSPIKQEFDDAYDAAYSHWSDFFNEAEIDLEQYCGKQFDAADKAFLASKNRQSYELNKIRRIIDMISGYQRKNRLSLTYEPQEKSDDELASLFSDMLMFIMMNSKIYGTMSDAFELGALVTGVNFVELFMDYGADLISGDIRAKRLPYNSVLLDPRLQERDLSDCSYYMRREIFAPDIVSRLLPSGIISKQKINNLAKKAYSDKKFPSLDVNSFNPDPGAISYDQYWKRKELKQKILIDTGTGDMRAYTGTKKNLEEIQRRVVAAGHPEFYVLEMTKQTVERNIFLNGEFIHKETAPNGLDEFPIVPVMGLFVPDYKDDSRYRLQGVVRGLRDPQSEVNRRRSQMTDIVESQINSGWIAVDGGVNNTDDLNKTGQGVSIFVKEGSVIGDVLRKIDPANIPASMFQMVSEANDDMQEIAGVSKELLGEETKDIPVAVTKLRQGAALTMKQGLFDHYRDSKKSLGYKILKMIKGNYTPEKFQTVLNREIQQEDIEGLQVKDVVPSEGILTDTQQQMNFAQLMQLKEMGMPIPDELLIDSSSLAKKKELKEALSKAAQEQSKQSQHAQQLQQLQLQLLQTQLAENQADAQERKANARRDDSTARLNNVKTMEGIQDLRVSRGSTQLNDLMGAIKILNDINVSQQASTNVQKV